jgi:hypothetical protein
MNDATPANSTLRLDHFPPSRDAGLARLAAFVPHAGSHYAKHRNTDFGPTGDVGVSGLSPYLRYRVLTEAEVIGAVLDSHTLKHAEKFVQEVVWRTYFKGWLEMRPQVWADYLAQRDRDAALVLNDTALNKRYQAAIEGRTGIEGFDDWAQDLAEVGYLHNHARMWFASIWIFTLKLPWALGADFFLNHLLDGDPASNTLSWRWVAGLQTQGKTYLARQDNIERFTQGRFSPRGLATEAVAVDGPANPAPEALPERLDVRAALSAPSVFIVHPDDLSIYNEIKDHPMVKAVVWVQGADGATPWPRSAHARSFVNAVIDDWAGLNDVVMPTADPSKVNALADLVGATQWVSMAPPVGPMADAMDALSNAGPKPLIQARRGYDATLWPLATKGFFPFKKQVLEGPSLIEAMS